jgi:hypothetical protein
MELQLDATITVLLISKISSTLLYLVEIMLTHELATCGCETWGCEQTQFSLCDSGLPARYKCNLRSSGMLRSADCY